MGKCLRIECEEILPENVSYCDEHKFVGSTTTRNEAQLPSDGGLTPPAPANTPESPGGGNQGPGSMPRPSGGRGGSGGGFGGFGGGGPGGGF